MRAVPREDDEQVGGSGHEALDSIRSWLASGAQVVDRRRRLGGHGQTRKLLVVDPAARSNSSERWHSTTAALQRHAVGGALSEMDPEHRRVITLAYLEGRTNREIAATLGVSVTTARRRLVAALERLEAIVSAAGAWLVAVLAGFGLWILARISRLTDSTDKAQLVATTVTVGAVAAMAVGVITFMPGAATPHRGNPIVSSVPSAAGPLVLAPTAVIGGPAWVTQATGGKKTAHQDQQGSSDQAGSGGAEGTNGCHGNPTGAPPAVPAASRAVQPSGPPVDPPGMGGCPG
jgi:sigma-70-like protein